MSASQTTAVPSSKVTAAGVGGAFAVVLAFALGTAGIVVPPGVEAAFGVIIAWVVAYFKRERRPAPPPPDRPHSPPTR